MENQDLSKYSTIELTNKILCLFCDNNTDSPLFHSYMAEVKSRLNKDK